MPRRINLRGIEISVGSGRCIPCARSKKKMPVWAFFLGMDNGGIELGRDGRPNPAMARESEGRAEAGLMRRMPMKPSRAKGEWMQPTADHEISGGKVWKLKEENTKYSITLF